MDCYIVTDQNITGLRELFGGDNGLKHPTTKCNISTNNAYDIGVMNRQIVGAS